MKYFLLFFVAIFSLNILADDSRTTALMTTLNTIDIAKNSINAAFATQKENTPEYEDYFSCIEKMVDRQAIRNLLLPIYKNNFTKSETETIIKFYSSSVGKKLISVTENRMTKDEFEKSVTDSEYQQLIKFTSSKLARKLPKVLGESISKASLELGEKFGAICADKLGYSRR